jgi:hypothetical protein
MERIQLFNRLEQIQHIDWRPNQLVSIQHLELVEPQTTLMIVWQKITNQQNTWPTRSAHVQGERSQVPHHISVSIRNQGAGIVICS